MFLDSSAISLLPVSGTRVAHDIHSLSTIYPLTTNSRLCSPHNLLSSDITSNPFPFLSASFSPIPSLTMALCSGRRRPPFTGRSRRLPLYAPHSAAFWRCSGILFSSLLEWMDVSFLRVFIHSPLLWLQISAISVLLRLSLSSETEGTLKPYYY